MKKWMIIFGIIASLLLLGGLSILVLNIKATALDKQSKEYADAACLAIITNWNEDELTKRASPELKKAIQPKDLENLFNLFRKLGGLKNYNGGKGNANISVTTQNGKVITAPYIANAEFEAGPAEIKIELIKHDDNWQILQLRINSNVFLPSMQK